MLRLLQSDNVRLMNFRLLIAVFIFLVSGQAHASSCASILGVKAKKTIVNSSNFKNSVRYIEHEGLQYNIDKNEIINAPPVNHINFVFKVIWEIP